MPDPFDFTGKVAVVTGGSRGLGLEMALALARHGADIVVASRKTEACEDAAAQIRALGRKAIALPCHVGEWDALEPFVDAVYAQFGRADILINNAGIAPTAESSLKVSEELFDKTVAVNFKGPFRLSALFAERMMAAGRGAIINISSIGSTKPDRAFPVYAGAKAALNIMTQCQAMEFGPTVRVNAIMCGPFWTDIAKSWRDEADRTSPAAMGRIGRPHEIATSALYLASDASSFTTGTIIRLDGLVP